MKVALMTGIKEGKIEEVVKPSPKMDEVLVKIKAVGVCGSDLHLYSNGRSGSYIVPFPFVLGHEASGEIVEVGENVVNLKVGDRVALEPQKSCGKCQNCKEGKYNLCKEVIFFSAPPHNGVLCEYVTHRADLCFKIGESVSYEEAALIEPLAVGYHAVRQADVKAGQSAVVLGLGCIGIMTILALKASGVDKIFAIDISKKKLDFSKTLGVTTINALDCNAEAIVNEHTNNEGVDLVFETAGTIKTTQSSHKYCKSGGTIVLVGMIDQDVQYSFFETICKELTIKSVFRYRNLYPQVIEAVTSKRIDLRKVITHRFKLGNTFEALNYIIENKDDVIKAVIEI